MPDRPRAKRFLRLLVALTSTVVLCVLGYRRGYDVGYASADLRPVSTALRQVVYPVGDLITPVTAPPDGGSPPTREGFDRLIDLIVSTVEHESWMEHGTGEGEIQPFPANRSLVIFANATRSRAGGGLTRTTTAAQ